MSVSGDRNLQEKAVEAIAGDARFLETFQTMVKTAVNAALHQASYEYWTDNPDVDVFGSGFDPMSAKDSADLLKSDASDLLRTAIDNGAGIAYQVLQEGLEQST